jgi:predicted  nucleic acid-binding Zn-ribbon protein
LNPEERFERIENGIRDLIAASRTVLEAQQRTGENIDALVEHQQVIDQKLLETNEKFNAKLNALIDTVERLSSKIDKLSDSLTAFVTGLQKPNGHQ